MMSMSKVEAFVEYDGFVKNLSKAFAPELFTIVINV
jgi:hypothetical protein